MNKEMLPPSLNKRAQCLIMSSNSDIYSPTENDLHSSRFHLKHSILTIRVLLCVMLAESEGRKIRNRSWNTWWRSKGLYLLGVGAADVFLLSRSILYFISIVLLCKWREYGETWFWHSFYICFNWNRRCESESEEQRLAFFYLFEWIASISVCNSSPKAIMAYSLPIGNKMKDEISPTA